MFTRLHRFSWHKITSRNLLLVVFMPAAVTANTNDLAQQEYVSEYFQDNVATQIANQYTSFLDALTLDTSAIDTTELDTCSDDNLNSCKLGSNITLDASHQKDIFQALYPNKFTILTTDAEEDTEITSHLSNKKLFASSNNITQKDSSIEYDDNLKKDVLILNKDAADTTDISYFTIKNLGYADDITVSFTYHGSFPESGSLYIYYGHYGIKITKEEEEVKVKAMYLQNIIPSDGTTTQSNIDNDETIKFSITQDTTKASIQYGDEQIVVIDMNDTTGGGTKPYYFPQSPIVDLKFIGKGEHKISEIKLE